jgi:hypothetical protein
LLVCAALAAHRHGQTQAIAELQAQLATSNELLGRKQLSSASHASAPAAPFPDFNSAESIRVFASVAEEAGLELDEVSYQLSEMPGSRHQRYRATATVGTDYAALRRFVVGLRHTIANAAIDNLACRRRTELVGPPLACELAVSTFYTVPHGQAK